MMNLSRNGLVALLCCFVWHSSVTQSFFVLPTTEGFISMGRRKVVIHPTSPFQLYSSSNNNNKNWFGDLWEEIIEFSTYGPSERRIIKGRRAAAAAAAEAAAAVTAKGGKKDSMSSSTSRAFQSRIPSSDSDDDTMVVMAPQLSMKAFQSAKAAVQERKKNQKEEESTETQRRQQEEGGKGGTQWDGYKLRDLIVSRWGVPLDVNFQRGNSGNSVYVTILPVVGYEDEEDDTGRRRRRTSKQARHGNELEYLQHLQAIIEILDRYDNLIPWIQFLEITSKVPKPGKESIPFRLTLSPTDEKKILGGKRT